MTWRNFMKEEHNFDVQTTFWEDFGIADRFGVAAVKDTYKRGLQYAKLDYKYLTELSMVLNHRLWMHYDSGNHSLVKIYDEIWRNCHDYAHDHLKGEEWMYYFRVTD